MGWGFWGGSFISGEFLFVGVGVVFCSGFVSPAGESLFVACPTKSNQKEGHPARSFPSALQKINVVPTRHPCRDVTQTHVLCVCH